MDGAVELQAYESCYTTDQFRQIRSFENSLHLDQLLLTRKAYWTGQLSSCDLPFQYDPFFILI